MGDITQLRFAQFLKSYLGLKAIDPGRFSGGVVAPVVPLMDPGYAPENRLPRGERLFGGGTPLMINSTTVPTQGIVANPGQGRLVVVKRITWSFLQPTSAVQPGVSYLGVTHVFGPPLPGGLLTASLKDGRASAAFTGTTTTFGSQPANYTSISTYAGVAVWAANIFPGAAQVPTIFILDGLDLVIPPNSLIGVDLRSDTVPTANYTWTFFAEGYERTVAPEELTLFTP